MTSSYVIGLDPKSRRSVVSAWVNSPCPFISCARPAFEHPASRMYEVEAAYS